MGDGKWLTVNEFAERIGVSDGTARSYADAGKMFVGDTEYQIRRKRLNGPLGHRRIWAEDVDEIVAAQAAESGTP